MNERVYVFYKQINFKCELIPKETSQGQWLYTEGANLQRWVDDRGWKAETVSTHLQWGSERLNRKNKHMFMWVCVHVWVCESMCVRECIWVNMCRCDCVCEWMCLRSVSMCMCWESVYVCVSTCECMCVYVSVCVCEHICVKESMCMCVWARVFAYLCVCICMCL